MGGKQCPDQLGSITILNDENMKGGTYTPIRARTAPRTPASDRVCKFSLFMDKVAKAAAQSRRTSRNVDQYERSTRGLRVSTCRGWTVKLRSGRFVKSFTSRETFDRGGERFLVRLFRCILTCVMNHLKPE